MKTLSDGSLRVKPSEVAFYGRTASTRQGKRAEWKKQQLGMAKGYLKSEGLPPLSREDFFLAPGYSGTNLNRPALSKLIEQIKKGKVRTVLVPTLDRLSRNFRDFVKLTDLFDAHDVSLQSIKEKEKIDMSSAISMVIPFTMCLLFQYEQAVLKKRRQLRACAVQAEKRS